MREMDLILTLKERLDLAEQQIETLYTHALKAGERALYTRMALSCAIGNMNEQDYTKTIADFAEINQSLNSEQANIEFAAIEELASAIHKERV